MGNSRLHGKARSCGHEGLGIRAPPALKVYVYHVLLTLINLIHEYHSQNSDGTEVVFGFQTLLNIVESDDQDLKGFL